MQTLIEFNYQITKKRGLINENTNESDFVMKLEEEVQEFIDCALHDKPGIDHELADIILVCFNIAYHYNIDIETQLTDNLLKNISR